MLSGSRLSSLCEQSAAWRAVLRLSLGAATLQVLVNCKPLRETRVPTNVLSERRAKLLLRVASVSQPLAQVH